MPMNTVPAVGARFVYAPNGESYYVKDLNAYALLLTNGHGVLRAFADRSLSCSWVRM
jgi:hypothetical protein